MPCPPLTRSLALVVTGGALFALDAYASEAPTRLLRSGLACPMPGGVVAGWDGDTGLDLAGSPRAVYAIAAGVVEYAEPGHTRWRGPRDTANSVRVRFDTPISWENHRITHAYYTHLSALAFVVHEGEAAVKHVVAGELLGTSGRANGVEHLHLGLLLDDHVEQDTWESILTPSEVRRVLGNYKNGETLPR